MVGLGTRPESAAALRDEAPRPIPAGSVDRSEAYLQEMAFIAVLASAMTVSMGSVV